MKTAKITYLIGTISFGILNGIGHLAYELSGNKTEQISTSLENIAVSMPGKESNMLTIDTGLSLIMGLMLLAYGITNLLFIIKDKHIVLPSKLIMFANILFSVIALYLVYKYLFIVPVVLTSIALIAFILAFIIRIKSKN